MAPSKNNLFDFDDLDDLDVPAGGGARAAGGADAAPEVLEPLRAQCAGAGLSAGWCTDAATLRAMLAASSEWTRYGIHALGEECGKLGVRVPEVNPQRDEVLWRMRCALVWKVLPVPQLEEECERRGIPCYSERWWLTLRVGPVGVDYGDPDCLERELRADLVRRLIQDSWQGERGPLPSDGFPGYWQPRCRSGAPNLPAWTGPPADPARRAPPRRRAREVQLQRPPKEPPRWIMGPPRSDFKEAGLRVFWFYMHFPWFSGDVPGWDAEFAWTDAELEAYFASEGKLRPKERHPREHAGPEASSHRQGRGSAQQQGAGGRERQGQGGQSEDRQRQQQQQQQPPPGQENGEPGRTGDKRPGEKVARPLDQHYRTLGLLPGAPADEVKKTYRKLALRYHPDKSPGQTDAALFRQIQEAYAILCRASAAG